MHSIAGTIALAEPFLSPALVSARALERLHTAASLLPASLSHCVYVECRPGDVDAVDLIVDVDQSGREILAGRNPVIELPAVLRADPAWARVAAFARTWLEPNGVLAADIADAWLEFDLGFDLGGRAALPPPSIFIDFADAVFRHPSPARRFDALATAAVALDAPLGDRAASRLLQCIDALPPNGLLVYSGFMLARGIDAVRLCVMGLSLTDLSSYLRDIAWPGDIDRVTALTTTLARADGGDQAQPAIVHIDVGESVGQSIGLEYPFARHPQLTGAFAESAFLDALVADGLMTAAHVAALRAWAGHERRTLPHELWPSVFARRVNHVKLVARDGAAFQAKIYLCLEYAPLGRK